MFRQALSREEKALVDRLRREALTSRPEFSETLHSRIRRAVRQCEAGKAPARRRPAAIQLFPRGAFATVAAICVLGSLVIAWQSIEGVRESGTVGVDAVDDREFAAHMAASVVEMADRAVEEIDALVDSTMVQQQWAYLDHDAQLVVQVLLDQLPFDVMSVDEPGRAGPPGPSDFTSSSGLSL